MILRVLALLLLLCSAAHALNGRTEVVVIMTDDVSTNGFGTYGEADSVIGTNYATPQLTTLASTGQIYLNVTSQPLCSPSRRDIFYGMSPFQHGAGKALDEDNRVGVPWMQRESLVSALQAVGVQVHITGKHHIQDYGDGALLGTATTQASAMGFDSATAMMLGNPPTEYPPTTGSPHAAGNHHYSWIDMNATTGATSVNTTYTTDAITTASVAVLQDNSNTDPMFLFISYSAPHRPFNPPPGEVGTCAATTSDEDPDCYGPSLTYIDTQLPAITAELDLEAEDILIYIGDNGRPGNAGATQRCAVADMKGNATPCGTRVPMVIKGVGVSSDPAVARLVNIGDLHDTILELFGAPQTGPESISFVDCFANPSTCSDRTISSAVVFDPAGLPVPPEDGQAFTKYEMHLTIVGGTTLYGMERVYDSELTATDVLYDLGSPSTIVEAKRYGPDSQIIASPSVGEQADALAAMQAEATRLIDSRWTGPPNRMVGGTMVGVDTK